MRLAWSSTIAMMALAVPAEACEQSIVSVDPDWSITAYKRTSGLSETGGFSGLGIGWSSDRFPSRGRSMFQRDGSRLSLPYRNIGDRPFLRAEVSILFRQGAHGQAAPLIAEWDRSVHQAGNSAFTFEKNEDGLVAQLDTNLNVELAPGERGTIVIEYRDDAVAKAFADIQEETSVTVCVHFVDFGEGEEVMFSPEKG